MAESWLFSGFGLLVFLNSRELTVPAQNRRHKKEEGGFGDGSPTRLLCGSSRLVLLNGVGGGDRSSFFCGLPFLFGARAACSRFSSRFSTAAAISRGSLIALRSNILRVRHPAMSIIVDSATPALRSSRAADLRKSCRIRPTYLSFLPPHSHTFPVTLFPQARHTHRPSPACTHSLCHSLRKSFTRVPFARVSK
jgi:hypothetical protein